MIPAQRRTVPVLDPGNSHTHPGPGTARPYLHAVDTALARAGDGYFDWLDHVWPAAGCTHPIRLYGDQTTIDTRTGEVLRSIDTSTMPDRVIYKACGNRRMAVCPSCAETYRRDAYQLIRSGLIGGKTVPASVAGHPAVFATFTAPGFGAVHTRHIERHHCDVTLKRQQRTCPCRPASCHARRDNPTCPHGRVLACYKRHDRDDPQLSRPLCPDCYDYDAHVIWNNQAGELWRRTKQAITRDLNQIAKRRGLPPVRLSHGKAAEYQARGAIHFHVLLRLDGIDPDNSTAIIPPPRGITAVDLYEAVDRAVTHIRYNTKAHPKQPDGWTINWGDPEKGIDRRIITLNGSEPMNDAIVAGYLAKYATKGTEITGHTSARLHEYNIRLYANPAGSHSERLVWAAWTLGEHPDFISLRRWAHMLGFGGHFLTKARHYSVTFAALRAARACYRRSQTPGPERSAERIGRQDDLDDETTLIIGRLSYVGSGWKTTGDALLANTAADQARRRQQIAREELAHEQGSNAYADAA